MDEFIIPAKKAKELSAFKEAVCLKVKKEIDNAISEGKYEVEINIDISSEHTWENDSESVSSIIAYLIMLGYEVSGGTYGSDKDICPNGRISFIVSWKNA